MKKFYIMILALILALAMILPMALPVAAANPKVVGYVSGSSYGGPDAQPMMGFGGNLKLLSDGTIVGHWNLHIFKDFDETAVGLPQDFFADTEWKLDLTEVSAFPPYPGLTFDTYLDHKWAAIWGVFKCVSNNKKALNEPFPGQYQGGIFWGVVIVDVGEPGVGNDYFGVLDFNQVPPVPYSWETIEHGNFQVWFDNP